MITTNVSGVTDDWSNYFSSQVGSYQPNSLVAKPWRKPKKLAKANPGVAVPCHHKPHLHPVSIEVTDKNSAQHCHHHPHVQLPCMDQHKPYGVLSQNLPHVYDDDKPDWHEFDSKDRKPMMFEEVIEDCNHHCGPGLIAVRPVEPTVDKSDEIEEEVIL